MSTLIVIPSYLPVILIKCRNYRYQNHSPLIFYIILNMLLNTQKLLHVYTSNFTFKKLIADINSITFPRIFLLFEPNLFQTNPKVRLVRLRCGSKKIFGGGGSIVFWELASHARSALGYHIYPSILHKFQFIIIITGIYLSTFFSMYFC